jgi:hypothetical protein
MRLILWCFLFLIACQRSERNPCPETLPLSAWDTIGDGRVLNETRFSPDSIFEYKHLSQIDTAITINFHGGWGFFDYYASIYVQSGSVRSDLFQIVDADWLTLNDSFFKLPDRGYGRAKFGSIKRMDVPQNVFRRLIQEIDSSNFWCTPRNAGQCSVSIDGQSWDLTVKAGNRFHRVHWTDCSFDYLDSNCIQDKCQEMQSLAMRIFYAAGVSKNKNIIVFKGSEIGKDSTEYALWIPSYFYMGSKFYCRGNRVRGGALVVSNRDKDWYKYLEIQDLYSNDTGRYSPPVLWQK